MSDALGTIHGTRIAHLIETDGPGGAERMLANLAAELQANGCPGTVFLPEHGEGWLHREIAAAGIPVEHYRLDHPFSPRCGRELAAAFRRHRIQLAHTHEFTMSVYAACAARSVGIPHVITMHGGRYYAGRLRRRLAMRFAVEASGHVVAVSQETAKHLSEDLHVARHRIQVIPNGVRMPPIPLVSTLRSELRLAPDDTLLVAVGNLYAVKGHRHLLDACALLPARFRAHVAIAGRGELAADLVAHAHALGIEERVHLLGLRDDIANLLAAADVFVHPSLAEGLPLALLEAMFAARPVVASAVGEIGQVLGGGEHTAGGAGLLVPPGDAEALARAITSLLNDPAAAHAIALRAARRARETYSLDGMVRRYADVYATVLARVPVTSYARSVAGNTTALPDPSP